MILLKELLLFLQNSALFELRLKQKGLNARQAQSILKRKASDALLYLWLRKGCGFTSCNLISLYNESFRLTGKLNRVALEQSLNEIIRRHEICALAFRS